MKNKSLKKIVFEVEQLDNGRWFKFGDDYVFDKKSDAKNCAASLRKTYKAETRVVVIRRLKSAFEMQHVKNVQAWAVTYGEEMAGRIVANYSKNSLGSVCTASVGFWRGPLKNNSLYTGNAMGYNDKFNYAVLCAIKKIGVKLDINGGCDESVKSLLEKIGYTVLEVI